MGGYSSDEEHDRRRKKKSKRSSRSRSGSNDSRKSKKSKHKKKRSRSRSKRRHRSRSDSRDRYHRSKSKRSRSRERYRSRSRSRGRHRSRERSYEERRSRSRGRNRSRSDSTERYSSSRRRRSNSSTRGASRDHSSSRSEIESISKSFADMTPAEQNQARMQLAIEKAKAADEAIRQRHGIDDDEPADTKKRQQDIRDIENEGFSQQTFSSNRNTSTKKKDKASELAFGTSLDYVKKSNNASVDSDSIMHPRLSEDESIRKMRWHEKLKKLRTKFSGS